MRDKSLRAIGILTGYEAISWFGIRLLVPPSQGMLTFLLLTAVGLATLLIYSLLVAPARPKPAMNDSGTAVPRTAPVESNEGPSMRVEEHANYPDRPNHPFYLLMGAGGVGKSSLLRSFLKLPSEEPRRQASFRIVQSSFKQNGSTRDGEFAIVDIDGELFEGELRKWRSILQRLLRPRLQERFRRWLTIGRVAYADLQGVFLVCSLKDLAKHGFFPPDVKDQLLFQTAFNPPVDVTDSEYAASLAERLRTVNEIFGAKVPVYVILTNLDCVPYAQTFFSKLSETETAAPLGAVLDCFAKNPTGELDSVLTQIFQAIAQYRVPVLQRTKIPDEKPRAYQYPRELMKLRSGLTSFLRQVFSQSGGLNDPILRSFHLTGKKDESAGKDNQHKTFFIADFLPGSQFINSNQKLFVERLLPERILTDCFRAYERPKSGYQNAWYVALALAGLLLLLSLWGISDSWFRNRALLGDVTAVTNSNQVAFADDKSVGLSNKLGEIERLRKTIVTLSAYNQSHPGMGWGLYHGQALLPRVRDLYFREFRKALLNPMLDVVRYRFEHLGSGEHGASFESVKNDVRADQMIHGRACQVDPDFLSTQLQNLWKNHVSESATFGLAYTQFQFYATELARQDPYNLQPNQEPVRQAQSYLRSFRGMDDIYSAIIAEANSSLTPARLTDVLEDLNERNELSRNYSQGMDGPDEVAAAFARRNMDWVRQRIANWRQASAGDPCIFGSSKVSMGEVASNGELELQQKYAKNLVTAWKTFLLSSHVRAFATPKDAIAKLDLLTQNRSPLLGFFAFVATNTAAAPPNGSAQSGVADLNAIFGPVALIVPPGKPVWKTEATDGYVQALRSLRDSLQNYVDKPSVDGSTADEVRSIARSGLNTVDHLRDSFGNGTEGVDHETERLLKEPFHRTISLLPAPKLPGADVDQALKGFCTQWQPLSSKFPFSRRSNEDVSAEEFNAIFRPSSGRLSEFVLKGIFIKTAESNWAAGPAAKDLPLDKRFVEFFTRMMSISDHFFHTREKGGVKELSLGFQYTIRVSPNPQVKDISFDVDSQDGGSSPNDKHFVWPGSPRIDPQGVPHWRFVVQARGASFAYPGLWNVFRMIEAADTRTSSGVELSKIKATGGLESQLIGDDRKPTKLELTLPDFPGGISLSLFSQLGCPVRAVQR